MRNFQSVSPLAFALGTSFMMAAYAADPATCRDDLDKVKNEYVMKSLAFTPPDRASALALIDSAQAQTANCSSPQFMAILMRIAAFARNGHDYVDNGGGWSPTTRLPVHLSWMADGLVVTRASSDYARLLGAHVAAIESRSPGDVLQILRKYIGGTAAYAKWNGAWILESPEMLEAIGIAAHADRVRFDFRLSDGTVESIDVTAVAAASVPYGPGVVGGWTAATSDAERKSGWTNAVATRRDPLYLQEPTRLFRMAELPELDALYIQFRANYDGPGESLADFARQVRQRLADTDMHHVILDQRFNTGGNTDITMDLMRDIGRHAKGAVYILIGPRTFSAGITSSAIVKHESANRAILVGEDVGDSLRWWSEGKNVCLPVSGFCMHMTDGLWDLVHGCAGEPACYGDRFHADVPDMTPAIPVAMTSTDWIAGRDPLMEAVAQDISGQQRRRLATGPLPNTSVGN